MTSHRDLVEYYAKYREAVDFIVNHPNWISKSRLDTEDVRSFCRYLQILTLREFREQRTDEILNQAINYYDRNKRSLTSIFSKLNKNRGNYKAKDQNQQRDYNPRPIQEETLGIDSLFTNQSQLMPRIQEQVEPDVQITNTRVNRSTPQDVVIDFNNYIVPHEGADENQIITLNPKQKQYFESIPHLNRSKDKSLLLQIINHNKPSLDNYSENFKPLKPESLYNKNSSNKFYGARHTWMFDIMYWSDSRGNRINYLLGININTRYAVGIRIDGKTTEDLIEAFNFILKYETIKTIIFDGESAIGSNEFKEFCRNHYINLHQTASTIHTQTAPIDRLCRTLRDYFKKWYIYNDPRWKELTELPWFKLESTVEQSKRILQYRKYFAKEGKNKKMIAPVPRRYNITNGTKIYDDNGKYVEFLDVIIYYNQKPHYGLQRIISKAMEIFETTIEYDVKEITPKIVHNNKGLELLIVKYCHLFNQQPHLKMNYKIGQKVNLYETDHGSLYVKNRSLEPYTYTIQKIHGNVILVKNDETNQEKWVSKYMIQN